MFLFDSLLMVVIFRSTLDRYASLCVKHLSAFSLTNYGSLNAYLTKGDTRVEVRIIIKQTGSFDSVTWKCTFHVIKQSLTQEGKENEGR